MSSSGTISIHKLGRALGAEVSGLDLRDQSGEAFQALRQALLDHLVLVIRDQKLVPAEFLALARQFGNVEPHALPQHHHPQHREIEVLSNRSAESGKTPVAMDVATYWRSDYSYRDIPAKETLLHALESPPHSGGTVFANLYDAYSLLPDLLKRRISTLQAIHNCDYRNRMQIEQYDIRERLNEQQRAHTPDAIHPVVRTHPLTRRPSLYVNPAYATGFVGMSDPESEALKEILFEYCMRAELHYTHRWAQGDVVIWDNRCTMHADSKDFSPDQHRTLWLCTVLGDKPYYIPAG